MAENVAEGLWEMLASAGAQRRAGRRSEDTLLQGCLQDQAAVYGVIAKLEALGLELLEFCRLPA